jgi:hypothetical protein
MHYRAVYEYESTPSYCNNPYCYTVCKHYKLVQGNWDSGYDMGMITIPENIIIHADDQDKMFMNNVYENAVILIAPILTDDVQRELFLIGL